MATSHHCSAHIVSALVACVQPALPNNAVQALATRQITSAQGSLQRTVVGADAGRPRPRAAKLVCLRVLMPPPMELEFSAAGDWPKDFSPACCPSSRCRRNADYLAIAESPYTAPQSAARIARSALMETSTRDRPKADGSAMRARGPEANHGQMRKQTLTATTTKQNNCVPMCHFAKIPADCSDLPLGHAHTHTHRRTWSRLMCKSLEIYVANRMQLWNYRNVTSV